MKSDMDYKERLKEALNINSTPFKVRSWIEDQFPELCESEDERIRKAIIEFFELQDDNTTYSFVSKKDIIAWLEKQGEQKPADKVEPKFKDGDWVVNTVGDTNQVVKVCDDGYTLDDNTFLSNSWATELIGIFESAIDGDHVTFPYRLLKDYIRILKLCQPQLQSKDTWKPSEEQMRILNEVLNFAANHENPHWNDYIFGTLNNLIRQLKKLREDKS